MTSYSPAGASALKTLHAGGYHHVTMRCVRSYFAVNGNGLQKNANWTWSRTAVASLGWPAHEALSKRSALQLTAIGAGPRIRRPKPANCG